MTESNRGLLTAVGAFTLWGLLPIYLKLLASATALEVVCHRIVWSMAFTLLLLLYRKKTRGLLAVLKDKKRVLPFVLTGMLLAVNWLTYIWAVNSGFIVEASLGYYINPLLNVALGVLFFQEKLRKLQWLAILFAVLGVCYLTFVYGKLPWIALVLAFCFGFYGLLGKKSSLPALEGLFLETAILFLPAFILLMVLSVQGDADFVRQDGTGRLLLAGTGIATSLPLLLFGYAARRMPLSSLGIVQYLAPSLQLCVGIFVYHESFPAEQLTGFSLVWCGLLLYVSEGVMVRIKSKRGRLTL